MIFKKSGLYVFRVYEVPESWSSHLITRKGCDTVGSLVDSIFDIFAFPKPCKPAEEILVVKSICKKSHPNLDLPIINSVALSLKIAECSFDDGDQLSVSFSSGTTRFEVLIQTAPPSSEEAILTSGNSPSSPMPSASRHQLWKTLLLHNEKILHRFDHICELSISPHLTTMSSSIVEEEEIRVVGRLMITNYRVFLSASSTNSSVLLSLRYDHYDHYSC